MFLLVAICFDSFCNLNRCNMSWLPSFTQNCWWNPRSSRDFIRDKAHCLEPRNMFEWFRLVVKKFHRWNGPSCRDFVRNKANCLEPRIMLEWYNPQSNIRLVKIYPSLIRTVGEIILGTMKIFANDRIGRCSRDFIRRGAHCLEPRNMLEWYNPQSNIRLTKIFSSLIRTVGGIIIKATKVFTNENCWRHRPKVSSTVDTWVEPSNSMRHIVRSPVTFSNDTTHGENLVEFNSFCKSNHFWNDENFRQWGFFQDLWI
jgi:hypothetical protein